MILSQIDEFDVKPGDNVLQFASLSFDASVSEIFMALLSGAALVLTDKEVINDPFAFTDFLYQYNVTIATLPPTLSRSLEPEKIGTQLKTLISAGEAADVKSLLELSRYTNVYNAYGPTECSVCATYHKVGDLNGSEAYIPIGRPIPNNHIYILDNHDKLVPIGLIGELCISGKGLSRGYLNNPELTSQKFTTNPFDHDTRIYRTGDMASWLPNGEIRFHGRKDDQVKIRGHRIEIGEVEEVMNQLDGIEKSFVMAVTDASGDQELVGYFSGLTQENEIALRDHLSMYLPHYMVPGELIAVDDFPITSNGKIDRKALPKPGQSASKETQYVKPGNSKEEILVEIWEMVLDRRHIGVEHNFFEVGGNSIKAIQLVSEIHKRFDVKVEVKTLFLNSTIKKLAQVI